MDDITGLVRIYAMVGRMRLVFRSDSDHCGVRAGELIVETYLGPDYTVRGLMDHARQGKMRFLDEFNEAGRKDLAAPATAIR